MSDIPESQSRNVNVVAQQSAAAPVQRLPIRLAFLGCGAVTASHSRTLRNFREMVVCSYASRDESRARDYNQRFGGAGAFGSYRAALDSGEVDAVLVATPPASHLELALAALRAGKHVILEKPPVPRASDLDAVAALAREANRQAMVAENYFYKPLAVRLREIIASGKLGEILFLDIKALKTQKTGDWRDEPDAVLGGALYEGGIHWVNLLGNIGLTITDVVARRPGRTAIGLDRSMLLVVRYAEGAVGTLAFSWETPSALKGVRVSRIYGTAGSVAFESNGLAALRLRAAGGGGPRLYFPGVRDLSGTRAMFRDFLQALHHGRHPRFTLSAARRDLELIEQAYASAAEPIHNSRS
jgi:predicted dehydrogenase